MFNYIHLFVGLFTIEIPFVIKAVQKYLDNNKTANIKKHFDFTSNGYGYKRICQRLNIAWCDAAWIAHKYLVTNLQNLTIDEIIDTPASEIQIDMKFLVPTMKLMVKYTAHKYLRRAWRYFWCSNMTVEYEGVLPRAAERCKYYWRKGFNMLQSVAPEMVSAVANDCVIFDLF